MSKAQILVVEDDNIVVMELEGSLQSLGHAVSDVASYGKEAIEKAAQRRPDLVLMDIRLKGSVNGIDAAQEIHERFDIPVIYLTAYADEDTLQRAKITEPYGYIVKPFEERELRSAIEMALYKHSMETKLKESERWLATTLRSISDAVIAINEKGLIVLMNSVAEALTGWNQEDAWGKDSTEVFNIIDEKTRTLGESPATRAIREGVVIGLANHSILIAKDGREIPIDYGAAPIRDDKGGITGVVLTFRDIAERKRAEEALRRAHDELEVRVQERTAELAKANETLQAEIAERKQAEEALRTSENRLAVAVAATGLGIYEYHVPLGKECYHSERWAEILGYQLSELPVPEERIEWAFEQTHPDDRPMLEKTYTDFTEGRIPKYEVEVQVRHKSGKWIYVRGTSGAMQRDENGRVTHLVGVMQDITHRKRAEEALRESEKRYRAVVEDQTELICRFLPNGTLTFVNDAYCRYFDRERKELIGNSFMPLISEEDQEYVNDQIASLSLDNPTATYEHRVTLPDGQIRWQQWTDRAIFDEQGRLVEYQSVGRDITERKQMEEAIKQRNRELSALNVVTATVNQSLDLDEVLGNALGKVLETMGLEVGAIRLLDKHSNTLDLKVYRGVKLSPQRVERISRLKLAESPLAKVVASGEPLVIEDISTHPVVELIGKRGLQSLVVIPLQSKGQVLGTMEITSLDPHQFTSEEMELLSSIGNQMGVAIHNSQLWYETNRRLQESTTLLEVSRALASVLELDHLLQLIIDSALETIEIADSGVIHLLDDTSGRLYPKAMAGKFFRVISKQAMSIGEGIAGLALVQGEVINVSDVNTDPRFIKLRDTHEFKSLLAIPLVADGENIGTISICSTQIGAFAQADERLMMTLAANAAIAVKNAQLFARSEQLAMLKERNRIASEIHDSLAQNLASLLMKIDFCLGLIDSDPPATKAMLAELKAFVRENIAEIRYSILALRHPALEELGFLPALRKYAQAFGEQTGIPAHLSIVGEEVESQLLPTHEYTLFRIIQEALNNVRRHARAKNVWIVVDLSAPDAVSLTITDDGLGFDRAVQETASLARVDGFGLTNMKERAEALGGRLVIETEPGSGTKITAALPVGKGG